MELTELRKLKIIELISEFKKSGTYTLYKTDFDKIVNDKIESKIIAEILQRKLGLIDNVTKDTYRLTDNGILFSSFEYIEKEHLSNKIDEEIKLLTLQKLKFEQFPAKFWWLILIIAGVISILTTWVNNQISESKNPQEQQKIEKSLPK